MVQSGQREGGQPPRYQWQTGDIEKLVTWMKRNRYLMQGKQTDWHRLVAEQVFPDKTEITPKRVTEKLSNIRRQYNEAKKVQGCGLTEADTGRTVNDKLNKKCPFFWHFDELWGRSRTHVTQTNINPVSSTVTDWLKDVSQPVQADTPNSQAANNEPNLDAPMDTPNSESQTEEVEMRNSGNQAGKTESVKSSGNSEPSDETRYLELLLNLIKEDEKVRAQKEIEIEKLRTEAEKAKLEAEKARAEVEKERIVSNERLMKEMMERMTETIIAQIQAVRNDASSSRKRRSRTRSKSPACHDDRSFSPAAYRSRS